MKDARLKFAQTPNNRITPCIRCQTNANVKRYKRRAGAGWQVVDWCHACNRVADQSQSAIPLRMVANFHELPEFQPNNEFFKVCAVCGSTQNVELHHWAPFKVFGEEFRLWPVSYLCHVCHTAWHSLVAKQ